jgi:hypothetical protein
MLGTGTIDEADLDLIHRADTVDQALARIGPPMG